MMNCDETKLIELTRAQLSEAECDTVIRHVESCSTCRERLQVMVALEDLYRHQTSAQPRRSHHRLLGIAASLAALCLLPILLTFYFSSTPPDWQSFSTKDPYPYFPLQVRSLERPSPPSHERAMQLYSEGDFQAAAQHLDQLPKTPDNNFFLGVCLYLNTEHERAAEIFTDIILSSPRWADAARWYRANIYLRQSNPHQALESLEQLIQGETEFAEEAKTLSRKIEEGLRSDSSRQMERDEIDTRKP